MLGRGTLAVIARATGGLLVAAGVAKAAEACSLWPDFARAGVPVFMGGPLRVMVLVAEITIGYRLLVRPSVSACVLGIGMLGVYTCAMAVAMATGTGAACRCLGTRWEMSVEGAIARNALLILCLGAQLWMNARSARRATVSMASDVS